MRAWLIGLSSLLAAPVLAQELPPPSTDKITPDVHPSKEGSSGVYHTRSAYTFPYLGAAFEGNDHFYGDDNLYQADQVASRFVETRDSLTVNVKDGIDFNACSIFRGYKFDELGIPNGTLSTALPSILEAVKYARFAKDRSWAIAIEPFYEMRSAVNDFRMDFRASPYGARALASRDFRYDKGIPLRLHGNLGYRRDRSADLLKRAFDGGFTPPAPIPNDPDLSTEELYELGVPRTPLEAALGLFRTDQILVAVAAEYLTPWVTPFVEYSGEYVLGGLSPLNSPQRLTLGLRATPRPDYHDLTVDLALDLGTARTGQLPTAADPSVLGEVEVEAPLAITVGVGWVFGYRRIKDPAPASGPSTAPASVPASAPVEVPAAPAPAGEQVQIGRLALWLPEGASVACDGEAVRLCTLRAPGAAAALRVRVVKEGASSPFGGAGPSGAPLVEAEATAVQLGGAPAQRWSGETPDGKYVVVRLSAEGRSYELRVEGASGAELAAYEAAIGGARLR